MVAPASSQCSAQARGLCHRRRWVVAFPLALLAPALVHAQRGSQEAPNSPIDIEPIVVTATRLPERLGDVPAALSVVDRREIQEARLTVGADESLKRVPGVFAQSSDNFAQDVRIQIRGFGTRAAFGVREIKVLVDGLPETLPDGHTELDAVDLGVIERVEVLRGSASSLYGNAAGGVIQLFTEDGPDHPALSTRLTGGSFGLQKYLVKGGRRSGQLRSFASGSFLQLDGYRDQSAARSGIVNAKLRYDRDERTDVTVLLNAVDAPAAEDAGGLTRAEADANPRQASRLNVQLDAGEEVQQGRLGLVGHHRLPSGEISAYVYGLYRDFSNRLPIPPATPPEQGGIVAFHRFSPGAGVRYALATPLLHWAQQLTAGVDVQHQDDERRRFANVNGERGALGLRQRERVTSVGPYVRATVFLRDDLSVSGGVRYDSVRFDVDVAVPSNSSSAGGRTLEEWSPGGGVRYTPWVWLSLFADAGTAFQVPTTTELANPSGAGFNPDVDPQTATSYEIGARADGDRVHAGAAAFFLEVTDELIPFELAAQPGRTFFRNAGRSRRYGLELDWRAQLLPGLQWASAVTFIDAEFRDYTTNQGTFDGNDEPGIPSWQVYQEIAYRHSRGVFAAVEAFLVERYFVDDANANRSPGYALCNLRLGYTRTAGAWAIEPFLGLNNLAGERYDGRVRLNAQNGRFFEPAPRFNAYGGLLVTARL